MSNPTKLLVVAPHPDDETLGVGGTIFRHKLQGDQIAWLIVTSASEEIGWNHEQLKKRADEIEEVSKLYGFDKVFKLSFPSAKLELVPMGDIVSAISNVIKDYQPEVVFLPHYSDIHTDHGVVFRAVASCTKWFRYPSVKRVLCYETLSETDFNLEPNKNFFPNVYVDITPFLEDKLIAMSIYASEIQSFPFPRSKDAIRALAKVRGASSGFEAAEAFQLLRERI